MIIYKFKQNLFNELKTNPELQSYLSTILLICKALITQLNPIILFLLHLLHILEDQEFNNVG